MVDRYTIDSPDPLSTTMALKTAKPETRFATDALHIRPLP